MIKLGNRVEFYFKIDFTLIMVIHQILILIILT